MLRKPASFANSEVGLHFNLSEARFQDEGAVIGFANLNVGGSMSLDEAEFAGSVNFWNTTIAGRLQADRMRVGNPEGSVSFDSVDVGDVVYLRGMSLASELTMIGADVHRLEIDWYGGPPTELDLSGTAVRAGLRNGVAGRSKSSVSDLRMASARVEGETVLSNLSIDREPIFEQAEMPFLPRLGSRLLGWMVVGYGRRPGRALYGSLLVLLIGYFVFRREDEMEPRSGKTAPAPYSPFWYTLDLFLPFVDLRTAGTWRPRSDRTLAVHYARVHTTIGWILIPIGLAALTGIIK